MTSERYCFSCVCPDEPQPHSSKYHKQMFQAFVAHDCCRLREESEWEPPGSPFNFLCSLLDHWARLLRGLTLSEFLKRMRSVSWTLVSLSHERLLHTIRAPWRVNVLGFFMFHFSPNCLKNPFFHFAKGEIPTNQFTV